MFKSDSEFADWLTMTHPNEYLQDPSESLWAANGDSCGEFNQIAVFVADPCADEGRICGLLSYMMRPFGQPSGEWYGIITESVEDKGKLFLVQLDSTKNYRDDIGDAMGLVPDYLAEGTPVRKTNRSGPATKGTRAYEGLGDTPFFVAFDR